jgi:magnesium-transporting ATPase (P-type)
LHFDRSLLTGERLVIAPYFYFYIFFGLTPFSSSSSDMIPGTVISPSDNAVETRNLALNSTVVVQEKYTGVVFTTGNRTIMGRIVGNLLACLATLNSRPQLCNEKLGSL